jgi:leucine-rich repeats and immunoglobulin-like domains protein 1/3
LAPKICHRIDLTHPIYGTTDDFPKPFITEEPITKNALKEENVTLTCKAESTSAASPMSAIWKKDNLVYKGSQVVTLARSPDGRTNLMTSELLLQNISDEDAGRYQCVVSNDFGSTYSSRAKITVHGTRKTLMLEFSS